MNLPTRDRFVHQVDVYLADTEATDKTGSLTIPKTLVAEGVTCLLNDKGGARFNRFSREMEAKPVRVGFPDRADLRQGNLLKYINPVGIVRWFLVDSFKDDQDLGRLWVAECTETPQPG